MNEEYPSEYAEKLEYKIEQLEEEIEALKKLIQDSVRDIGNVLWELGRI